MPINFGMMDTQYPQRLADLFNPASIQARQAAASNQQIGNQLNQAQLMQAAQTMKRAPELARREDVQWQAQQDEAQRVQQEQAKRQVMMQQLPPEQRRMLELGVPAKNVLMPDQPKLPAIIQEMRAAGISETSPEGHRMLMQRLAGGGAVKIPMAPVAYVDDKGQTIWGTITEAKGRPAANYNPMVQSQISGAKASGKETGQSTGESMAKLQDLEAMLPRLKVVTDELSKLGKKATYTMAGQASNFARRQLGMDVGEGAIARKEYISKVDNEILPLLRQTFGAQFTQKEGESLKATLGDTNASPEEKDAVLKSFIETKIGQIAALQRRVGQPQSGIQEGAPPPGAIRRIR